MNLYRIEMPAVLFVDIEAANEKDARAQARALLPHLANVWEELASVGTPARDEVPEEVRRHDFNGAVYAVDKPRQIRIVDVDPIPAEVAAWPTA